MKGGEERGEPSGGNSLERGKNGETAPSPDRGGEARKEKIVRRTKKEKGRKNLLYGGIKKSPYKGSISLRGVKFPKEKLQRTRGKIEIF